MKELLNEQKFFSFDLFKFPCFNEFQNHEESSICHLAFTMANTMLYKHILSLGHLDSVQFLQCVM